jgi:hypothetical protein
MDVDGRFRLEDKLGSGSYAVWQIFDEHVMDLMNI